MRDLATFLLGKGFTRGKLDNILFILHKGQDMLVIQIYVDDIIFGATNEKLCEEFSKTMQGEFEMSMMGELTFFLGLQIKQRKDGIFISQTKYYRELLKKFGMDECKEYDTPMSTTAALDADIKGSSVSQSMYRGMIADLIFNLVLACVLDFKPISRNLT